MKEYIFSIIAAAIITAIVGSLVSGKTSAGKLIHLLTGTLMVVTVIAPLTQVSFENISEFWNNTAFDADSYVSQGEAAATQALNTIIKDRFEAYILDKATRMGLEIAVEVDFDGSNDSIPSQVTINGALSPYAKGVLSEYITDHLGIPKECQNWI